MTDPTKSQLQQEYEGARLAVAAYGAEQFKALLATNPNGSALIAGTESILVQQGFSATQANSFVAKYTPVAALDQDGAGAVLFRVNGTNQIATTIRGTEAAFSERGLNDLVLADGTIAQNQLPTYQTTLIANFVLRETSPADRHVPQFSVKGVNSNADDLARATFDTIGLLGRSSGSSAGLVTVPVVLQTSTIQGTGRAVGPCVDAAAHSEGAPEITTLGSAIAQCSRITTLNGPGVSLAQMQSMADQITVMTGLPQIDLSKQNQLNIHTTGLSIIDGLNGGLPGEASTVAIPTSYAGVIGDHSSIIGMNAAEAAYFRGDVSQRIAPVGTVTLDPNHTPDYNFADTAGAGRGTVNPDAVKPPSTVFNPATALPSYSGDNAVKVQPGDTVSSIAKRYDMTVQEFSSYLKEQFGDSADLSSIVAGYKLPIPLDVYERTLGGLNGLDLPPENPFLTPRAQEINDALLDAFSNPQVPIGKGTLIADNSGKLPLESEAQNVDIDSSDIFQSIGLFNGLNNLQNWHHLSDIGKLSAMLGFYNAVDGLGAAFGGTGNNLPGDFAETAGWLNLAQGVQSGDGLIIANGINHVSDQAVDEALNSMLGSSEVPYVSALIALNNLEDNPAQSIGTLAGMYVAGPLGGAIGGFVGGAFGGLFSDDDIPMRQGLAHAQWDAQGQTQIITTQDAEGGGSTANSWMSSLVDGLQTQLQSYNSQHKASDGMGLALIPNLLPSVGFTYDPDGYNLVNGARGFMYLQWTDDQGHTQTRFYDGAGNRGDGSGETLSSDFVQHAQSAIAPAWQVQTVLAHYQQSGDIDLPTQANSLPQALSDGLHQTLQVVSLGLASALPTEATPSNKLIDVDGDGYLEQTQWVQANQAILSADLNGDGQISLGETVNLQDAGQVQQARTSLAWLDVNQDARLTAQDPAFAAIRLWVDINADGKGSGTELQSLSQAGITAIDFSTNPPRIERADGSVQILNVQTLTANTLGVAFQTTAAGLVQTTEQQDGTGQSVQYAVNTRAFDGQAARTQGGTQDVDGSKGAVVQADVGKLSSITYKTIANVSLQTSTSVGVGDARLKSATTATATVTPSVTSAASNTSPETRVAFVPAGQNSAKSEVRLVTQDMIESAGSSMFGAAGLGVLGTVGLGATASAAEAAAVQANVVSADSRSSNPSSNSANPVSTNNQFIATLPTTGASSDAPFNTLPMSAEVVVKQAEVFSAPVSLVQEVQVVQTAAASTTTSSNASPVFVSSTPVSAVTEAAPVVAVKAVVISSATSSKTSSDSTSATSGATAATSTSTSTFADTTPTASSVSASSATYVTLDYPVVNGETLPGTEDVVLRLSQDVLLANDSTPNASADPNAPALTITAVADAVNGQVSLKDGVVVFIPNTNFHGEASFTYTVTDQYGLSTTGSTALVIVAVNDVPVTQGETGQTQEDTAMYFNMTDLLGNDSDVDSDTDGQVLSITGIAAAQNGSATLLTDGRIRFAPDSNFHGTAQFTYIVNDGNDASKNGSAIATVNVDVLAVNDAPITQQDTARVDEDIPIFFTQAQLLKNDSDVDTATDGQVLSITAVSGATNGSVSMLPNGDIQFIPNANYHGVASFTYTVSDGNGGTKDASVNITVNAVNDTPVVQGESTSTNEDTTLSIDAATLLTNDSDVDTVTDEQMLSLSAVSSISGKTHGTVSLVSNADGTQTVQYTPDANYHGVASFNYTVSDGNGGYATSVATVTVAAVNDAPVTVGETSSTDEDVGLTFTQAKLLENDSDVDTATDGQVLTITAVSGATNGKVSMLANGDIRFTPNANYHGAASFTYTVSDGNGATTDASVNLTVLAVNDSPTALGDVFVTQEDNAIVLTSKQLLANDTDNDIATDGDVLTISRVFDALHCTVTLNTDGTINLVPDAQYHGNVRFSYEITDISGATSTAFVVAGVSAVNDAPVSQSDSFDGTEDTLIILEQADVLANDTDNDVLTDGDSLSVQSVINASHGTARLLSSGQIEFLPDANYHGLATFDYVVTDTYGATSTNTVTLSIGAVNDTPVVQGESTNTNEDTTLNIAGSKLLANDSDVDTITDGQVLSLNGVSSIIGKTHGTVSLVTNVDGTQTVQYTPDTNYHGTANFNYIVSDGNGGYATSTATVTVSAVNDAPVTADETDQIDEDKVITWAQAELLANDSDVDTATDGQVLSITEVSGASNGTVSMLASGDVQFIPSANYHGTASFTYTVSDSNGGTTDASVSITVNAVNDTPVVQGESTSSNEDTTLSINAATLLTNDSDVDTITDGQVLNLSTVGSINGKTHGTVTLFNNADGTQTVQYTPDANYHGTAIFNYTVSDGNGGYAPAVATVTVAAVNDAPITLGETSSTDEDTAIVFTQADLLANDSDVDTASDGQVLIITAVSGATNGTVSMLASGDIQFIPNANYHGAASFIYTVSDGNGGTTDASVSITVNAVNDTPMVLGETVSTSEDTTLNIAASTLLGNDSDVDIATDGQVLSLSSVSTISGKTHGTVALVNNADGTQTVQFIPDANYHGVASFNYTVSDGNGGYATAVATVTVAAVNDAPVTVGETSSTDEDTGLTFTQAQLLNNDSDVDTATDGQLLTITAVSGATNGKVSMLASRVIQFIPNANYHGAASFTYTVSDGNGGTADARVNITVDAVNDAPVVQGESTNTNEDTSLLISAATLLSNDSDVDTTTDGQVLRLSAVNTISGRTHGTVTLLHNADGTQTVEFIPDASYHGVAAFSYTVSDSSGGYATAVASINLAAVNDAPVTIGETSSTNEDVGLIFTQAQLLSNDSDVDTSTDGQVLTITSASGATDGTVSMLVNGDIRFMPTANYHGAASFTYTVSDGNGGTADASVSITVKAVNDVPVVTGETVSTNEDTTLWFIPSDLLVNDTDVDMVTDGQVLTITAVSNAVHGAVAFVTQADGKQRIAFTPEANYVGVASYQYTVSDGNGGTASTTVVINLSAVNDAPDAVADSVNATEDTLLTVTSTSLLDNDTDVDNLHSALRIVGVSNATHGSVSLSADGRISFSPELNYFGLAAFNYNVSDGVGGFSVGTATVNIAPVNDKPVAVGESLTLNEDETVSLTAASLLANDSDVDNSQAQLRVVSVGDAVHGSVSLVTTNGNTHIVFTPELNFYGAASFTYTVNDGVGGTANTRVELNLIGVNDAPVVNGELYAGKRDVSYSLSAAALMANDTDVETPNGLTLSRVGNAQHGSANLVNGNIVFVPESGYSGLGSFDYMVCDADGGQATGTAQIDFSHVNVNPTVVDDSFMGTEDTTLIITAAQLLANDADNDNATGSLRVSQVGSATHGTVNLDAQGNVLFTPDANFNGQASFSYQVADPDGGSTWGNAWLSIASVNDAPIIEDVWYGRPVYGYHAVQVSGYDTEGYYSYIRYDVVTNLNDAMSFLHSGVQLYKEQIDLVPDGEGGLQSVKNYRTYSPSYYRNGDLRPISFDTLDATKWIDEGTTLTDDPYRQNGGVVAYDPDGDSGSLTFSISATPQHGHAWINGYTNALAPEQQDHTQVGAYWVNQAGAWQYYSSKGDTFSGTDPFSLRVTDAGGASVDTLVTTSHTSWPVGGGGGGGCSLVVDLDGDGVELIAASDSHLFEDVNGDGWRERTGWASSADGLLALDRNGDALISCVDSVWAKFVIWQDANSNGIQESGEFRSLNDLGVASIALADDNKLRLDQGNVVLGETQLPLISDKSLVVADVMLAGQHVSYPMQVQDALLLQQAEVMRKALFFNQLCTTASSENHVMLGFVDTSDPAWHGVTDLSHHELSDSRVAG